MTNATTNVTANMTNHLDPTPYTMDGGCIACMVNRCGNGLLCPMGSNCDGDSCICTSGCAGVNSKCHQTGNEMIMKKFILKNVKKERKMYVKLFTENNQIRTTSDYAAWSKLGRTDFNLYLLPGDSYSQKRFLLVSNFFPEWAITTWPSKQGSLQPFMFVARKMSEAKSLGELAVVVCDP